MSLSRHYLFLRLILIFGKENMDKTEEIKLANGQKAVLIKNTKAKYNNIFIVQLDGVLRVVDKETKSLAETLGVTHNKHAYYVRK